MSSLPRKRKESEPIVMSGTTDARQSILWRDAAFNASGPLLALAAMLGLIFGGCCSNVCLRPAGLLWHKNEY